MRAAVAALKSLAGREAVVMSSGLAALVPQTQRLLGLVAADEELNTRGLHPLNPLHARFATRSRRDIFLAAPWAPFLALVPGSLIVFSACALTAPATLPSTFSAARARLSAPQAAHGGALAGIIHAAPLVRRLASDAPSAHVVANLSDSLVKALADACGLTASENHRESLVRYGDEILFDDSLLGVEAALSQGVFSTDAAFADEIRCMSRARLLATDSSLADQQAALREYLSLRESFSSLPLLMAVSGVYKGKE